jgi:hypothetical protein
VVRAWLLGGFAALVGGCVIAEAISYAVCEDDYEACAESCDDSYAQDPERRELCHAECDEMFDACVVSVDYEDC